MVAQSRSHGPEVADCHRLGWYSFRTGSDGRMGRNRMAKRKRSKRPAEAVRRPPPRELDQVQELLEQQDYARAREQLLELADRPNPHPMVLQALASVAQALEDWRSYLLALRSEECRVG